MKKGLVIGKFYPPHRGHSYLIEYAAQRVDELTVLICDHPNYHIPAAQRQAWLQQMHPTAEIQIIPDIEKDDDSTAWAKHTLNFLGYKPDVVFSSEDYGVTWANEMGSAHQMVDRERTHIPISATRVRKDVLREWEFINPVVRSNFAIRVCVLGAESTGTTTLSKALAEHYQTTWAQEYGRYYTESMHRPTEHSWHSQEFVHIARMQQQMENQLAGESNGLLICDTNAFATRLWHQRYMGFMSPEVDQIAAKDKVDLYILTGDEIPFEDDGVRDGEDIRHAMHKDFVRELQTTQTPYIEVRGSVNARLAMVQKYIDRLLKTKVNI